MLKQFGRTTCPRCESGLVHEFDTSVTYSPAEDQSNEDQHWLCPNCGLSRPVVYRVERGSQRRNAGLGALSRFNLL
ncbi:MAG TPA: hypothetical protein VI759_03570 [Dehalococcoidia bacterium]|nr:hypothetical protein [Dehalococcoidia bacterium]